MFGKSPNHQSAPSAVPAPATLIVRVDKVKAGSGFGKNTKFLLRAGPYEYRPELSSSSFGGGHEATLFAHGMPIMNVSVSKFMYNGEFTGIGPHAGLKFKEDSSAFGYKKVDKYSPTMYLDGRENPDLAAAKFLAKIESTCLNPPQSGGRIIATAEEGGYGSPYWKGAPAGQQGFGPQSCNSKKDKAELGAAIGDFLTALK